MTAGSSGSPGAADLRARAYALLRTILISAVEDGFFTVDPAKIRGAGSVPRRHQVEPASNHPSIRERMAAALDALSFVAPQTVEHTPHLDAEGRAMLVQHLAYLGARARWIDRFVPVISAEADSTSCCRYAWAHLGLGLRSDLRSA